MHFHIRERNLQFLRCFLRCDSHLLQLLLLTVCRKHQLHGHHAHLCFSSSHCCRCCAVYCLINAKLGSLCSGPNRQTLRRNPQLLRFFRRFIHIFRREKGAAFPILCAFHPYAVCFYFSMNAAFINVSRYVPCFHKLFSIPNTIVSKHCRARPPARLCNPLCFSLV